MKRFNWLPVTTLIFAVLFTFQSCTEDDPAPGGSTDTPASVSLVNEPGFLTTDALLSAGSTFKVKVTAAQGTNTMRDLAVKLDDSNIPFAQVIIDGAQANANPTLLFGTDQAGFTKEIELTVPNSGSVQVFSFVVTDNTGLSNSVSIEITALQNPPVLTFVEEVPYFWSDANLSPGTIFKVKLAGAVGDVSNTLNSLSVYENDTLISVNRMALTMPNAPAFNPVPWTDAVNDSLALYVKAHSDVSKSKYSFILHDDQGLADTVFLNISTLTEITGALLNASGPQGQGGLDLDTGNGNLNSDDSAAEIRDEGIDINAPSNPENWIQRISAVDGSEIRKIGTGVPETFDFDLVETEGEIIDAFNNSDVLTFNNPVTGNLASDLVEVGDLFTVLNSGGDRYYVLRVTDVTRTDNDNADSYVFDIKY